MDIITAFFVLEISIFIFAISIAAVSSLRHRNRTSNSTSNTDLSEFYLATIAARELGTLPKASYSYEDLREQIERTHRRLNEK